MPIRFLNDAERARLSRFPEEIPEEIPPDDLNTFFTLTSADRQHIEAHHRPATRLGVALQLCALRYLGFSPRPADMATAAVPVNAVQFLAAQLSVSPDTLNHYGRREQTRTEQWQQVQQYLGYRAPTPADLKTLTAWLSWKYL